MLDMFWMSCFLLHWNCFQYNTLLWFVNKKVPRKVCNIVFKRILTFHFFFCSFFTFYYLHNEYCVRLIRLSIVDHGSPLSGAQLFVRQISSFSFFFSNIKKVKYGYLDDLFNMYIQFGIPSNPGFLFLS